MSPTTKIRGRRKVNKRKSNYSVKDTSCVHTLKTNWNWKIQLGNDTTRFGAKSLSLDRKKMIATA